MINLLKHHFFHLQFFSYAVYFSTSFSQPVSNLLNRVSSFESLVRFWLLLFFWQALYERLIFDDYQGYHIVLKKWKTRKLMNMIQKTLKKNVWLSADICLFMIQTRFTYCIKINKKQTKKQTNKRKHKHIPS